MTDTVQLRRLTAEYLGGIVPLEVLDTEVALIGERASDLGGDAAELWSAIELRIAEFTSGHLDEAELRGELASFVPLTIVVPADLARNFVISTALTSSQPIGRVPGAADLLFPGVGTRLAAGRA